MSPRKDQMIDKRIWQEQVHVQFFRREAPPTDYYVRIFMTTR